MSYPPSPEEIKDIQDRHAWSNLVGPLILLVIAVVAWRGCVTRDARLTAAGGEAVSRASNAFACMVTGLEVVSIADPVPPHEFVTIEFVSDSEPLAIAQRIQRCMHENGYEAVAPIPDGRVEYDLVTETGRLVQGFEREFGAGLFPVPFVEQYLGIGYSRGKILLVTEIHYPPAATDGRRRMVIRYTLHSIL